MNLTHIQGCHTLITEWGPNSLSWQLQFFIILLFNYIFFWVCCSRHRHFQDPSVFSHIVLCLLCPNLHSPPIIIIIILHVLISNAIPLCVISSIFLLLFLVIFLDPSQALILCCSELFNDIVHSAHLTHQTETADLQKGRGKEQEMISRDLLFLQLELVQLVLLLMLVLRSF